MANEFNLNETVSIVTDRLISVQTEFPDQPDRNSRPEFQTGELMKNNLEGGNSWLYDLYKVGLDTS